MDIEQEFENKRKATLSEMSYAQQNNILLQANLDATFETNKLLTELNELKRAANDQQTAFEKTWKLAKITASLTVVASILTQVIDIKEDGAVLMDRASKKYEQIKGQVKEVMKDGN